jgi:enoyl-CoA hydratase/carnithine racemase
MGTVIRSALTRAGIDAAQATRLCLADEAAAALAALSDAPELERADGSPAGDEAQGRAPADDFSPKILALARGFVDGPPPDFAKASFAELYAWPAQPPAE